MATKWKNGKSIIGFLSFVLGVSLLLSALLPIAGNLISVSGRQRIKNALKSDFQETENFRSYLSGMMNSFIAMGAGGPIDGTYYNYSDLDTIIIEAEAVSGNWGGEALYINGYPYVDQQPTASDKARWKKAAEAWNNTLQEDRNILYYIERNGEMVYSNTGNSFQVPDTGYSFLLSFNGTTCTATKNGISLDLYGDGFFQEDGEHWELPGYTNFKAGDDASNVRVQIAIADTPALYIKGNYSSAWAERQYNHYYWLEKSWKENRTALTNGIFLAAAGLTFILLWFLLRKYKVHIDHAIASSTEKIWFEVKVILIAISAFFLLLPLTDEMHYLVQEVTYMAVYEYESTYLQIPWFLGQYLYEITCRPEAILTAFWTCWLFCNDLRYGKKPWRNGIFGMLRAKELNLSVQKRLSRSAGLMVLTALLLGTATLNLLIYWISFRSLRLDMIWILCLLPSLFLVVSVFYAFRLRRLWTDLGAITDQITSVRNGDYTTSLPVPIDSDLIKVAQEIAEIQQGMAMAVEEQTRSERMKVELVTNVSHDIKTPLTSIISYAELLKQENLPSPAKDYVEILNQKAERLCTMVLDVFDVSKAASGNLPVNLEPLDLDKLLRQTLADMAESIDAAPVTLRQTLADYPVMIIADGQRLYRVFQNLLQNALKYALEGSRIYLSLSVEDHRATVSLKNTSKTELPAGVDFTERFVRGDVSRTDGGSGLGLAIADSFTRACGGEMKVEPIADLFVVTVTFPLTEKNDTLLQTEIDTE